MDQKSLLPTNCDLSLFGCSDMNSTSPPPRERDRRKEGRRVFPLLFAAPSLPLCKHPISHITKTLSVFPFFRLHSLVFSFSATRIGTCRIHEYLITDIFNLTNESCYRCEGLKNEGDSEREEIKL